MTTEDIMQEIFGEITKREEELRAKMVPAFDTKNWIEVAHIDGYLDALRDVKVIIEAAFGNETGNSLGYV